MAQNPWSKPVDVELETLIRARYPIIYVVSWEERRVEETLREICQKRGKKMIQWTITSGLGGNVASRDPLAALDQVLAAPDQTVFLLKDFHPFMNDHMVVRKLRDLVYALKTSYKTLVLLSPVLKLPVELEKEITVVDYQLPTPQDLDRLLEGIIQSVRSNNQIDVNLTPLEREQILKAASGLTSNEAENVFAKSLVEKRKFDIDVILSEKEQIIRKSGILEYYPASEAFSDVGGMDLLKEWMSQRTASFTDQAREYGLPEPKGVLLLGVQGCGKCFEKDTPILMHDGTVKKVQEVAAGDLVMGPDSQPRTVLSTTTGQGELFRVTPTKGRPYTVNADHILTLRLSGARRTHKEAVGPENIINIPVRDYLTRSASFKRRAMGYRAAVDFPAKPVLIDPYFLGVWLGDGTTKGPSITTADPEIVEVVETTAEHYGLHIRRAEKTNRPNRAATYHLTAGNQGRTVNPLLDALREIGVLDNKHIPLAYKANSREVRLRLLAGLIDTDGCMAGNDFEVIQKRKRLADDIAFVARSLGLAAYVTPAVKSCKMLGMAYSDTYYRVHISGNTDMIPVLLHRKQANPRQQRKNVLNVGITVESVGTGDYYGFMVSGDHRFLLDDFTVVHNSLTAKAIGSLWKLPLLRLDVGKIFGGIVGQSEENIRKAISTAESVAPCVTGDTRITLWGGAEKTIQELYDGQETELTVQGMDESFRAVPVRVTAITRREAPDLFTIKMRHATLQATSNHLHPVLRDGRLVWTRTDALQIGDAIAVDGHRFPDAELLTSIPMAAKFGESPDVTWTRVVDVSLTEAPEFVYDLCCDKIHNFVANGVYTHNCILWIDELEKGFSGTQSSGSSDGGTTSRVFGTFLAWMQDKKAPVFVIATSNDVTALPPELLRKGRFDEIFFVDLPSKAERKEIFDIHLKKRGRDPKNFDTEQLGKVSVGFSGAEIEQAVVSALFSAFADRQKDEKTGAESIREVTVADMERAVKISVPLSVTMQESIDHLRTWAEERARPVSSVQSESAAEILSAEEDEEELPFSLAGLLDGKKS